MFSYHIGAAYNFTTKKWFQESSNDLPANAWLNRTGVTPSYPMISDTVMVTGTDVKFSAGLMNVLTPQGQSSERNLPGTIVH